MSSPGEPPRAPTPALSPPLVPAPVIRGLTDAQLATSVQDFFARFPFEPATPDPAQVSAQEFLSFLR